MYFGFGFSAAVFTCVRICSTSSLLSGVGFAPAPTKHLRHHQSAVRNCHELAASLIGRHHHALLARPDRRHRRR
jgi:hypothetical protein